MSQLYPSLSHSKWDCKYHIVFTPKCRLHLKLRHQAQTDGKCAIALTEIMSAINGHNTALLELGLKGAIAPNLLKLK